MMLLSIHIKTKNETWLQLMKFKQRIIELPSETFFYLKNNLLCNVINNYRCISNHLIFNLL